MGAMGGMGDMGYGGYPEQNEQEMMMQQMEYLRQTDPEMFEKIMMMYEAQQGGQY